MIDPNNPGGGGGGVASSVTVDNFPNPQNVSGTVNVGNFPATQPVSGSVSVGNFPNPQTVTGTVGVSNFPATQTVSGTVIASVANFPATQPVSGTVSVANFPAVQAVASTPMQVYDGGLRTVVSTGGAVTMSGAVATLLAAAPGLKTKVLSLRMSCATFTTAGNLSARDGVAGASLLFFGYVSALGQLHEIETGGFVVAQTSVNTSFEAFFGGNAQFYYQLVYYQAP